jgi:Predicted signal transduction protein with a C-terminal ATPase domain
LQRLLYSQLFCLAGTVIIFVWTGGCVVKKHEYQLKRELHTYFFKVLLLVGIIISAIFMTYYSVRETAVVAEGKYWRLAQSVTYVDRIMEEVATIGDSIWTSSQIQGIKNANINQWNYLYYRSCMEYISNMEASANNIYRIRVFDVATGTLITSRNGVFYGVNEEVSQYYQGYMERINNLAWVKDFNDGIVSRESNKEHFLYYVRPIYSIVTGEKTGLLCIDIPKEVFSALMEQREPGDEFVIIDEAVEIPAIWSGDNDAEYLKDISLSKDSKFDFYVQRRSYTAVYQQSDYSGWHFYLYYPSTKISFDWGIFVIAVLLLGAILIVAYAMIIRIFRRRVEEPIEQLLQAMADFEQGEFGVQVESGSRDMFDEIFYHFNHMSLRTKELVKELIVERIRLKDGKLKMLQSQIKPHFLYNIFNSMIWLTEQKIYDRLEQMVYATAGYYKTSLNFGNDVISLFDNLNQLKYYAKIQEIRFPTKFHCEITFEEEILCDSIPNLLLQPLLENAIGHGAVGGNEQTLIRVNGYQRAGNLVFEIWDNGAGIEPERLMQIRKTLKQQDYQEDEFFALANVAQRIRMSYYDKGNLMIESVFGEWTRVTIQLPKGESECIS